MTVAALSLLALLALVAVLGGRTSTARRARLAAPGASLSDCPGYPNCVSTEAREGVNHIAPVPFVGEPAAAFVRARAALLAEPGARLVLERPGYLRAEVRSRVLRFVDDVEIAVDASARVYRMRSAARLGRRDFGVNRARMERVSARLGAPAP